MITVPHRTTYVCSSFFVNEKVATVSILEQASTNSRLLHYDPRPSTQSSMFIFSRSSLYVGHDSGRIGRHNLRDLCIGLYPDKKKASCCEIQRDEKARHVTSVTYFGEGLNLARQESTLHGVMTCQMHNFEDGKIYMLHAKVVIPQTRHAMS